MGGSLICEDSLRNEEKIPPNQNPTSMGPANITDSSRQIHINPRINK